MCQILGRATGMQWRTKGDTVFPKEVHSLVEEEDIHQ